MKHICVLFLILAIAVPAYQLNKPAQAQEQKVTLGLRLQEGKSYNLQTIVDQQIAQTIQNQKIDLNQTIGFNYVYEVVKIDENGVASVNVTYKAVQFRSQGPTGAVDYDSTDAPKQVAPTAKGFAALVGETFSMKLAPSGRVLEIQGVSSMLQRVIGKLDLPPGPARTELENNMKGQFGDQAMKASMENLTAIYPDRPVEIGDSWTKRVTIDKGFPMILESTYTLKARKNGVAVIALRNIIKPNPDAQPVQVGAIKMRYALSGEMQGTLEMEESTGWITHSQQNQKASGQITLLDGPQGARPTSWPISIKSIVRLDSETVAHNANP